MKMLIPVFLLIFLFCTPAMATVMNYDGCRYDCHEEKTTYTKRWDTVKEIKHTDIVKEMLYINRTSTPIIGPNDILRQCINYIEYDKIKNGVTAGTVTDYTLINGRVGNKSGETFARCDDPTNEKWIKKWVEELEVDKTVTWSEFITIPNEDLFTISKWVCFPLTESVITYFRGGGGYDYPHNYTPPIGSAPVPEPSTILLLGVGLLGFASISKFRKK